MEFVCKNRAQCLFQSLVCDGIKHCEDGSDEDAEYAGCGEKHKIGKKKKENNNLISCDYYCSGDSSSSSVEPVLCMFGALNQRFSTDGF